VLQVNPEFGPRCLTVEDVGVGHVAAYSGILEMREEGYHGPLHNRFPVSPGGINNNGGGTAESDAKSYRLDYMATDRQPLEDNAGRGSVGK
jgi:hypothetical protein